MRWESLQLYPDEPGEPAQAGAAEDGSPDGPAARPSAPALFERGAVTRSFDTPAFRDRLGAIGLRGADGAPGKGFQTPNNAPGA